MSRARTTRPRSTPPRQTPPTRSAAARLERDRANAERRARAEVRAQRRAHAVLQAVAPQAAGAAPPTTIELGAQAETIAVDLLRAHGYEIVERNYRCEVGELDVVAVDGDVMVFVEVRSRASDDHGDAIESVNRRKQRKVTRVAEVYLAHKQPANEEFRFDVVAINGADEVTLYQDAWRGGLL